VVAINPIDPIDTKPLAELLHAGDAEFMAPNPPPITAPTPVYPGAPALNVNPT